MPRVGETWERRRQDSVAAPRTINAVEAGAGEAGAGEAGAGEAGAGEVMVSFSMPIDDEIRRITLAQWHRWVHVHEASIKIPELPPRVAAEGRPHEGDALIVIDVQPTFMPGGELPVAAGYEVVPVINRLLGAGFACVVATQDWHAAGHSSFASAHAGARPYDVIDLPYGRQTLWPDHALQGSPGAALHPALKVDRFDLILRKGFRDGIDSYSAFLENDRTTQTGLASYLRERGVRRVFLCGLAFDFCVGWSAEDAVAAGFEAVIVEDACRGIGLPHGEATTMETTRARLAALGVGFVEAATVVVA